MSNWRNKNLVYEDVETSNNNWRGAWGGFYGWSTAGIKSLRLHGGVFRRHKAVGNRTWGFWLDTDNQDITIEDALWCNNFQGAFVELSQGPIIIRRTDICTNQSSGLVSSVSQNVTVVDSVLYENASREQFEVNDIVADSVDNWETGQTMTLRTQSWTLCGNAFVGAESGPYMFSVPDWDFFLRTLKSARNAYWNPRQTDTFWLRTSRLGGRALNLVGWQRVSGQDASSVFADPRFSNPEKWNFIPLPGSGWLKC